MLVITNMRKHCCITFLLSYFQYHISNTSWPPMLQYFYNTLISISFICSFSKNKIIIFLQDLYNGVVTKLMII